MKQLRQGWFSGDDGGMNSTFKLHHLEDRGSFDRNSLDQNCVLLVDRNFHNQLTKFF
jgi:hypothetical protein